MNSRRNWFKKIAQSIAAIAVAPWLAKEALVKTPKDPRSDWCFNHDAAIKAAKIPADFENGWVRHPDNVYYDIVKDPETGMYFECCKDAKEGRIIHMSIYLEHSSGTKGLNLTCSQT